jgi:ring-1,2-phenylacetyl-CoA epoxidase subunit PaaC
MEQSTKDSLLILADNLLILGQRLGEWCGHGPILEQDIALTNIALDLLGEARNYYQYLAETEGKKEDDYAMFRDARDFKNALLTEQPNGHWGDTLARQFLFDCFHFYLLDKMTTSVDKQIAAIARKSVKEAAYHLSFSGDWLIRLGDGTEESHLKIQQSLNKMWPFWMELFTPTESEKQAIKDGILPDYNTVYSASLARLEAVLHEATLQMPETSYPKTGGKTGLHSEHLGYILADLQYLQKSYPNAVW